jgi:hypothetical protein
MRGLFIPYSLENSCGVFAAITFRFAFPFA